MPLPHPSSGAQLPAFSSSWRDHWAAIAVIRLCCALRPNNRCSRVCLVFVVAAVAVTLVFHFFGWTPSSTSSAHFRFRQRLHVSVSELLNVRDEGAGDSFERRAEAENSLDQYMSLVAHASRFAPIGSPTAASNASASSTNAHVFAAHVDPRHPAADGLLVVGIALARNRPWWPATNTCVYCHFWFPPPPGVYFHQSSDNDNDNDSDTNSKSSPLPASRSSRERLGSNPPDDGNEVLLKVSSVPYSGPAAVSHVTQYYHETTFGRRHVECPLPAIVFANRGAPVAVSYSEDPVAPEKREPHALRRSPIYLLRQNTGEAIAADSFALCTASFFNDGSRAISRERFVEYVELNRLLGARHVFVFATDQKRAPLAIFPALRGTLEHYISSGLLSLFDMRTSAPIAHPYTLQNTALSDCLFRAMQRYRYVVNTDFDEFIVPHGVRTWAALVDGFFHSSPASEYVFKSSYHTERADVPFFNCDANGTDSRNESRSQPDNSSRWCVDATFAEAIPALAISNESLLSLNVSSSNLRALHANLSSRAPLATLWQTTRERHVFPACSRSKVIALAADVAFPGIHQMPRLHQSAPRRFSKWEEATTDCLHGPEHTRIVPPAVALVHHYQAFHGASISLPSGPLDRKKLVVDRALWRYSDDLHVAITNALKEISKIE